jgi:hypothetical protein
LEMQKCYAGQITVNLSKVPLEHAARE